MKKIILLIACVAIGLGVSAQQSSKEKKFTWGVKGGLNLTTLSHSSTLSDFLVDDFDDENNKEQYNVRTKPSFYAGFFGHYQFSCVWGLQAELIYSRQGNLIRQDDLNNDSDYDKYYFKNDYLNVPIFVTISPFGGLNLSVDLGVQVGFGLNPRYVDVYVWPSDGDFKEVNRSELGDYGDKAKNFDCSVVMGLTYNITRHVNVSARYNMGLTPVTKDKRMQGYNTDKKFCNRVIQLGVGYAF